MENPTTETVDYLNYMEKMDEGDELIRDIQLEETYRNEYEIRIRDLETGKEVWKAVVDQFTMKQDYSIEIDSDVMVLTVPLSESYVIENGDKEFEND